MACAIVSDMVRLFLLLALCLSILGCGRDITDKQLGEPCTRTSQCELGLACLAGVCQLEPDAGVDAGT